MSSVEYVSRLKLISGTDNYKHGLLQIPRAEKYDLNGLDLVTRWRSKERDCTHFWYFDYEPFEHFLFGDWIFLHHPESADWQDKKQIKIDVNQGMMQVLEVRILGGFFKAMAIN